MCGTCVLLKKVLLRSVGSLVVSILYLKVWSGGAEKPSLNHRTRPYGSPSGKRLLARKLDERSVSEISSGREKRLVCTHSEKTVGFRKLQWGEPVG